MKSKILIGGVLAALLFLSSCFKTMIPIPHPPSGSGDSTSTNPPGNTGGSSAIAEYDGIVFAAYDWNAGQFFSTFDTSFKKPLSQYSMTAAQIKNVDMMFIYNTDYWEPGFIDPTTAAQHWYWDDYYSPWLDSSVQTNFYITSLSADDFNAAKASPSLLTTYFSDSTKVRPGPSSIFPVGSTIGGRQSSTDPVWGVNSEFKKDKIFGFKNVKSGKLGLIHVSTSQESGWPAPLTSHNTYVDILKQK
jgi:hypothetical protein